MREFDSRRVVDPSLLWSDCPTPAPDHPAAVSPTSPLVAQPDAARLCGSRDPQIGHSLSETTERRVGESDARAPGSRRFSLE